MTAVLAARARRAKRQRMILVLVAIVAVLGAVLLAMSAMSSQASFFYAPADVRRSAPPAGQAVRIGGMVRTGSLRRAADGVTIDFLVGDETSATIPVRFTGIVPNLFKEGSGVVAEGSFGPDGRFTATNILAKHDENYTPPSMRNGMHETDSLKSGGDR